jgi:hypothetical protein
MLCIVLSVVKLNVAIFIMLCVIILKVIMLSVVTPYNINTSGTPPI